MPDTQQNLAALLGSRICHDLISPLGAIGNGVELLAMDGAASGPELSLISESVDNANARIRFFRVAFGAAAAGQQVARREIISILSDYQKSARVNIGWEVAQDPPRQRTKLAFLLLQCLEVAMPYGGKVTISEKPGRWTVQGTGDKLRIDPALWEVLSNPNAAHEVGAAEVQFALVPPMLAMTKCKLTVEISETDITASF